MSVLSQALGDAGTPHAITHDGVPYEFVPYGQGMKDAFEKELYRRYREAVPRWLDTVGVPAGQREAAAEAKFKELERQFMAGGFVIESEAGAAFLGRAEGRAFLLQQIVRRPPGCPEDAYVAFLKAREAEVAALIDQVMRESLPGYARLRDGAGGPAGNGHPPPVMRPPPGAKGKGRKKKRKSRK